jgi:hypothetical protein
LDGAGEGQIFLRNLTTRIMGTKPECHPVPTILNIGVVIESLSLGSYQVNEGQGGLKIL